MKKTYEEDFFEGIFKHAVGDFTSEDLVLNKKWFYGWYRLIEKTIPFKGSKSKNVLEVGCSLGASAVILKEKKFNVFATDVSKYAVDRAKKLVSGVHFSELDITKPIKMRKKFDYIIGFEVIEHIKNPAPAIRNLKKVLKPGGYMILTSPPPFKRFIETPTHVSVLSDKQWVEIFKEAGFREKNMSSKKVTFPPIIWKHYPKLNIALPFHVDLPRVSSTNFYFLRNEFK